MIDRKISDVQNSYDDVVADEYVERIFPELEHKPLDRQLLDRFAEKCVRLGRVCDMGCGPGHVARYLHEQGMHVVGVDLSLDDGQTRAKIESRDRIHAGGYAIAGRRE